MYESSERAVQFLRFNTLHLGLLEQRGGQGATGAVWAREVGWAREGASHMKSQRWRLTAAGVHGDPYLEMAVYSRTLG